MMAATESRTIPIPQDVGLSVRPSPEFEAAQNKADARQAERANRSAESHAALFDAMIAELEAVDPAAQTWELSENVARLMLRDLDALETARREFGISVCALCHVGFRIKSRGRPPKFHSDRCRKRSNSKGVAKILPGWAQPGPRAPRKRPRDEIGDSIGGVFRPAGYETAVAEEIAGSIRGSAGSKEHALRDYERAAKRETKLAQKGSIKDLTRQEEERHGGS